MEWWFIAAAGLLFMGILIRGLCQVAAEADAEIERMQRLATQGDDVDRRPVLVAYANEREVRYVRYKHKLKIEDIPWEDFKKKYRGLVLFGSCGDLMNGGRKIPAHKLVYGINYYWITDKGNMISKGVPYTIFNNIPKKLAVPVQGICTCGETVHDEKTRLEVLKLVARFYSQADFNFLLWFVVEMETFLLRLKCDVGSIPIVSVRYISDRCEKRVMPWGINHYWRIYQDWRMQRMFDKLMMEVCCE